MTVVELNQVKYSYRTRYHSIDVLKGVSHRFEEGKIYALVGKSGSGKSTLLSLMAGLDVPEEGDVLCRGISTREMKLDRYRREQVSVIYQSFRLLPMLTVLENVMYPLELRGIRGKKALELAKEQIRKVNLPDSVFDRFPAMLSGGEQQRVAIARALSTDCGLLLADEPTGNLDSENGDHIIDLLLEIAHREGYCVILATHDLDILPRMDEVIRIQDGQILLQK